MAIAEAGTFLYQATIDSKSLELVQPALIAREYRDRGHTSLLGPVPQIILNGDDMAIVASSRDRAAIWKASFAAGDLVKRFACDADTLCVGRESTGSIGVSLLRARSLVTAFGAIEAVPLGSMGAQSGGAKPQGSNKEQQHLMHLIEADRWVTFKTSGRRCDLHERESALLGDYDIYLDRCWTPAPDGPGMIAAISLTGVPGLRDATLRSAVLLGHSCMKATGWEFFSSGA